MARKALANVDAFGVPVQSFDTGLFGRAEGWKVTHGPTAGTYEQHGQWTRLAELSPDERRALWRDSAVGVEGIGPAAGDQTRLAAALEAIQALRDGAQVLDLGTGELRPDRRDVETIAAGSRKAAGACAAAAGLPQAGPIYVNNAPAPLSNTGAQNTDCGTPEGPKGNRALVDYLGCTFHGETAMYLAEQMFGAGMKWEECERGGYYFHRSKKRGEVTIYFDHMKPSIAEKNPVFVLVRGKGCRQLESEGLVTGGLATYDENAPEKAPWCAFLAELLAAGAKFPRLDVALDTFDGSLDLDAVMSACTAAHCSTRFGIVDPRKPLNPADGSVLGHSVDFGNRKSNMYVRMYHKGIEQKRKGEAEEVADWVRVEVEAHDERAMKLAESMIRYGMKAVAEVLWSYIDFKEPSDTDSNKSRWKTVEWWSKFLEASQKLVLGCDPRKPDLEKIVKWVTRQVAPSLYVLREAPGGGHALLEALIDAAAPRLSVVHVGILLDAALKGPINEAHRFDLVGQAV